MPIQSGTHGYCATLAAFQMRFLEAMGRKKAFYKLLPWAVVECGTTNRKKVAVNFLRKCLVACWPL